ncbi:hypothetical protein AK88_01650 [Plasmodium fragile]|uniref:Myosin motor domain-containing protein n=1 Tax=Plasmodium fragile TaxID=5857 RepID=A0A0D9QNZ5_PLAFR|nr:uncharacterized protein AK88_01650 [Plasmodium fragile]KJP88769.1 hypothetical protein AK88_01650 [Plasmodium fragile]
MASPLHIKSNETFYYSNISNVGEEMGKGSTNSAGASKREGSYERKDSGKVHSDKYVWCFYNNMYKKMEVCGFSESGKSYTLKRKGETLENVPKENVTPCLKEHIHLDSENNVDIIQLNEPNVIENLKNRYAKNKIYTFHVSLLLAINPYKQIKGLYGMKSMNRYLNKFGMGCLGRGRGNNLSDKHSGGGGRTDECFEDRSASSHDEGNSANQAHIYDIGNMAYKNMVLKKKRQTIVVSGHSGSGKTENCKILFKYFHYIFFHKNGGGGVGEDEAEKDATLLRHTYSRGCPSEDLHPDDVSGDANRQRLDKLIYINSIIEAMSNAKTIKNNNSSRCGRINDLVFEERKKTDETIFNYCFSNIKILILLLELNRCISHNKGERNFHIFYQVIRGLTDAQLSERGLVRDVHRYRLLTCGSQGGDSGTGESALEEEQKDEKNFQHLMEGLRYIQYDEGRINELVDVIAGVIHLGEIDTGVEGEGDSLHNEERDESSSHSYKNACACLRLPIADLQSMIKFKCIHVSGERIRTRRSRDNSMYTLHSLIKVIYKNVFNKVVSDINRIHLSSKEIEEIMNESVYAKNNHIISILDLYGFEDLASNDFEQLCINLANEKLNNYYIMNEVEKEKQIYKEENILWTEISIPNYKDTILLVEKLFSNLDDITKLNSSGQKKGDENFFSYLLNNEKSYLEKGTYGFVSSKDGSLTGRRHGVKRNVFFVRHYAGCVAYTVNDWIKKNSDRVEVEIQELIAQSGNWFLGGGASTSTRGEEEPGAAPGHGEGNLSKLQNGHGQTAQRRVGNVPSDANCFLASAKRGGGGGGGGLVAVPTTDSSHTICNKNVLSVSKKYIKELDKLFSNMENTDLHYIRCILPNEQMKRDTFKRRLIYTQLKQCGAIEMVKVVNRGLSHKVLKGELLNRCVRDIPNNMKHCRDDDVVYYFMRLFGEKNTFKLGTHYIFMGSSMYTDVHGYLYGGDFDQISSLLPLMEERKEKIFKEIREMRFRRSVLVVQIYNWMNTYYRTYLNKKKRMKEMACDYMYKIYLIFKTVMSVKRTLGYNVRRLQRVLARKAYGGFFKQVRAVKRRTSFGRAVRSKVGAGGGQAAVTTAVTTEVTKEGNEEGNEKGFAPTLSSPPCQDARTNCLHHVAPEIFVATPDNYHHVYNNIDWVVVFREKQLHLYIISYSFERMSKKYLPDYDSVTVKKVPWGGETPLTQFENDSHMPPPPIHCSSQHPVYKNIFLAVGADLSVRIFTYPTLDSIKSFLKKKIELMKKGSEDVPSTYLPQLHRSRKFGGPSSMGAATRKGTERGELFSEENLKMFMHMYKNVYVLSCLGKAPGGGEVMEEGGQCRGKTRKRKEEYTLLKRINKEEYLEREMYTNPSFKMLKITFLPTSLSQFMCLSYVHVRKDHYLLVTFVNYFSKPIYNYTTRINISNVINNEQFWNFFLNFCGESVLTGSIEAVRRFPGGRKEGGEEVSPGEQHEERKKKDVENYLSTIKMSVINNTHVIIHGACLLSLVQVQRYDIPCAEVCAREYEYKYLKVVFNLICFEVFSHVCDEHLGKLSHDLKHGLVVDELFGSGGERNNSWQQKNTRICLNGSGDSHTCAQLGGPSDQVGNDLHEAESRLSRESREAPRQCAFYIFSPRGEIYVLTNGGHEGGSSTGGELFRHGPWAIRKFSYRQSLKREEGKTQEGANEEDEDVLPYSYYGIFNMNLSYFYKQEYYKSFVTLNPSVQATIRKYVSREKASVMGVSRCISTSLFPDVCVLREWNKCRRVGGMKRDCLYYSLRNDGEVMTLCHGEGQPEPLPDSK